MASELSKLIDDQLAEVSKPNGVHAAEVQTLIRNGSSDGWTKKQGVASKIAGAARPLWTEPWWTREWWTKRRIVIGVTAASLLCILFLFFSGSGSRSRVVDSSLHSGAAVLGQPGLDALPTRPAMAASTSTWREEPAGAEDVSEEGGGMEDAAPQDPSEASGEMQQEEGSGGDDEQGGGAGEDGEQAAEEITKEPVEEEGDNAEGSGDGGTEEGGGDEAVAENEDEGGNESLEEGGGDDQVGIGDQGEEGESVAISDDSVSFNEEVADETGEGR